MSEDIEKSLDRIVMNWIAKGFYSEITEGQLRKILYDDLNPYLEEIKKIENEIADSRDFCIGDTDELSIELSRKKMNYIRRVAELLRIS
jgi:hypothetical protein